MARRLEEIHVMRCGKSNCDTLRRAEGNKMGESLRRRTYEAPESEGYHQ